MLLLIVVLFSSWTTELVTTETGLQVPLLAVDSLGNPYVLVRKISSAGPQQPTLYYLFLYYKVNGNWMVDTFEQNAVVSQDDLVVGNDGRIWCIYSVYYNTGADTGRCLIVANKDSGVWSKDTIINCPYFSQYDSSVGTWFSISTDHNAIPHITYDLMINGIN